MRLRLQAQRSQPRPTRIDVSRLSDQEIRSKYAIDVSNRFDALLPFESSEDAWISFKKNVLESATANIGRAKRAKKAWVQFDTLDVIEQRRKGKASGRHADLQAPQWCPQQADTARQETVCGKEGKRAGGRSHERGRQEPLQAPP